MNHEDERLPIELARMAVEAYVREGVTVEPPEGLPEDLRLARAGVFVCLKIRDELRGCVGTVHPVQDSLAREIIVNAVEAASRDTRFEPVGADEVPHLVFSVDVLEEPEEIIDERDLDPKIFGVIVRSGSKVGLLLPDLDGVRSAEAQVAMAKRKAGISGDHEDVRLFRFRARRYVQDYPR